MKFHVAFKFLLLFSFILFGTTIVEAGEIPSSGSGGGISLATTLFILAIVAIAAIFGTKPVLAKLKSRSADKILSDASNKDKFWDITELKKHAEKMFYNIQDAWENRDMEKVKNEVDPSLYSNYTALLTAMKNSREKNMLSQIQINEIRIVGTEDYIDNSKDRYIAYIQGRQLDYVINEDTQEIIKNPSQTLSPISVSYHFVRKNNTWILENIDTTVTLQEILQMKNFSEK